MTGDLALHAVALKGLDSGQALEQDACQRIGVDSCRVGFVRGESLRGHVGEGADRGARARQLRRTRSAGDAEIDQVGEVVFGHQNVRRFDVAVHEADAVGCVQRGGDLLDDRDCAAGCQAAVGKQFGDGFTVDQPHGHIQAVVDLTEVMYRDDVRFVQPGRHLCLAAEPRLILLVVCEVRRKQLQRNHPAHGGVERLPHFTHAAATQKLDQPVPAERCAVHGPTLKAAATLASQSVRSTRMVSRFVPKVRTPKLLSCGSERNRSCGSSSGIRWAVPLCH